MQHVVLTASFPPLHSASQCFKENFLIVCLFPCDNVKLYVVAQRQPNYLVPLGDADSVISGHNLDSVTQARSASRKGILMSVTRSLKTLYVNRFREHIQGSGRLSQIYQFIKRGYGEGLGSCHF